MKYEVTEEELINWQLDRGIIRGIAEKNVYNFLKSKHPIKVNEDEKKIVEIIKPIRDYIDENIDPPEWDTLVNYLWDIEEKLSKLNQQSGEVIAEGEVIHDYTKGKIPLLEVGQTTMIEIMEKIAENPGQKVKITVERIG